MSEKIITELYNSKEIDSAIYKMVRHDLFEDFKHDLFIRIMKVDSEQLRLMYERNQIRFYVVRCIINLSRDKYKSYHKNYLTKTDEITGDLPDLCEDKIDIELREGKFIKAISEMDNHFGTFFYRAICELVNKHGSIREVSRQTNIPLSTVHDAVKVARKYIKERI